MSRQASSLFQRIALLISVSLLAFGLIAWEATAWTAVGPTADAAGRLLVERVRVALEAERAGRPLPADARRSAGEPPARRLAWRGPIMRSYVDQVSAKVREQTGASEARFVRFAPSEIWLKFTDRPNDWLVLSWRLVTPKAPRAVLVALAAATLIVLVGAAVSARRLAAPLASLAHAADELAEGRRVRVDMTRGPGEVRAVAHAFDAMSRRLTEADEQRELLLAGISHDLRTPLARLRVAIELLEPGDAALLEEMRESVDEMDQMLGQFLQYVRASYRETPSVVVLDDLVRQALRAEGAEVRFELDAPVARRFAKDAMRHAVINLTRNALAYGREPVVIQSQLLPGLVELVVHDQGAGLSPGAWRQAIRPFERAGEAPDAGHSGVGLALVDRLVAVSGGKLTAKQGPEGFCVRVSLPAADA